jgi:hypothetical protein
MGRTIVVLALVTGCLAPSQNKRDGYVAGGALVALGAGLVGLSFVDRCKRNDGLINNCDLGEGMVITLGAIASVWGLIKIGVELMTPEPEPDPAPSTAPGT